MLKSETKTINGTRYEVTQLPYSIGHKLLLRVYKVLGPMFAEAFAQTPDLQGKELGDLKLGEIGPALAAAAKQLALDLTEEDFDFLVETLADYTHLVDDQGGKKKLSNQEREFRFAGNYLELFQWLAFALRVNYLGFSNGRDVLTEALARAQAMGSKSQSE